MAGPSLRPRAWAEHRAKAWVTLRDTEVMTESPPSHGAGLLVRTARGLKPGFCEVVLGLLSFILSYTESYYIMTQESQTVTVDSTFSFLMDLEARFAEGH